MSKNKKNRNNNTTASQPTASSRTNTVEVNYDENTLETLIMVNGKTFDTSRINGKEVADWAYPFMMRKVRWNGFYDEMVQALGGQKAFDLVFEGSEEALAELKEAWENAPVNIISGGNSDSVVTITYDENNLTTEITVNGQSFDTSRINGEEIADWVYPFMMRKVKWQGIFDELAKAIGSQEYTIQFSGSNAAMNELMEECPETVSITMIKKSSSKSSDDQPDAAKDMMKEAHRLFSNNQEEKAIEICHKVIDQYDYSHAYFMLGGAYRDGKGAPQNSQKAIKFYTCAFDRGLYLAADLIGLIYKFEKNDLKEAVKWYKKGAEKGDRLCQCDLAECYLMGYGVEENDYEAFKWYKESAEQGYALAQAGIGKCYYNGWGTEVDYNQAVKWYKASADQGNDDGQYGLAVCYIYGDGVAQDEQYAVELLTLAAEQGHAIAQARLGDFYYYGDENDDYEAFKWYKKSAEQGNRNAQYGLSRCYMTGEGTRKNEYEGIKWLQKSAEQGYAKAENSLGSYFMYGIGVQKDIREALTLYKSAAEKGNTDAMVNLAMFFLDQDDEKENELGFEYAMEAAENDHAYGMYLIALCYGSGIGVREDQEKAFEYCEMGAKAGDVDAVCMLADFFADNSDENVVEVDYREALNLYELATEIDEGCGYAYYKIGLIYYFGFGVRKDEEAGMEYIRKAADLDEDYAIDFLDNLYEEQEKIRRYEQRNGAVDDLLDLAGMIPGVSEFTSAIKVGKKFGEKLTEGFFKFFGN